MHLARAVGFDPCSGQWVLMALFSTKVWKRGGHLAKTLLLAYFIDHGFLLRGDPSSVCELCDVLLNVYHFLAVCRKSWRYGNNLCLQPHSKIVGSYSKLVVCRKYSSKSEDQKDIKNRDIVHEVLQRKKERLKETGQLIIKDIKETRDKMKEKMEEVIERENIWTIPNLLCILRIGFSPLLGYFIVQSDFNLALALLTLAGISDVLDGWIARTFQSQASKMGSFLDPMADKVLVGVLFLSLTYMDLIPAIELNMTITLANYATEAVILTGTIIARDLLLVGAGFYIRYQSLPLPGDSMLHAVNKLVLQTFDKAAVLHRTLSRYFDVTYATAQLAPTTISKVNTAVQLLMVASTLAAPVFNYVDHSVLHMLWYITAGTTITSAVSYLVTKDTYKFFKPSK
uniref:cardiolipin synthase (CMP-forming) n=1 Tax=Timema shepardi TaxID=629360 RepID=A0A7R9B0T3_TIMSH|nr:unnamed protein product [Timema shepardi]